MVFVLRASSERRQDYCRVLGVMFSRPRPCVFCWLKQDKALVVVRFIASAHLAYIIIICDDTVCEPSTIRWCEN